MRQSIRSASLVIGAFGVIVALAAPACGSAADRECRVGADCASGICSADGTCVRSAGPGGDAGDGGTTEGGPTGDSGGPDTATDAALPGCTPNKDGTITRDEVPLQAGLTAKFRVGTSENVSTAGTPKGDGSRTWDYSAALASDVTVLAETLPLAGKWYATKFPGATYSLKLQEGSDLLGVFEVSPGALLLRGVVSPDDSSFTKTELTNTPAVSTIKFPLSKGSTWTSKIDVSGTAQGVALFGTYSEQYDSAVDAAGQLKTPLGTFDVLRVKTTLVRRVGVLAPVTIRTFAFVTECYSTIAVVTSDDNEPNEEFTHAKEIRRIAP